MSETVQLIASHDIGGYRPYPAYKASGVEWLGEVPEGWEVRRLKTIAEVNLSNVDKKSAEGQDMVLLCNYTDVYYNEHITNQIDFMRATATPEQIKRFSLKEGDVLITKDSESWDDIAVPAVVSEDLDNVLCGYHLAMIRPTKQTDGRFLARAFSAVGPKDQFHIKANGITRFGLGGDAIRTGLFALPPLPEQHAIAAFLDHKTAEIDALIAAKERLIALLREKRAALITSAVTKGLDPDVAMKDSGVEWLGEVPEGWEVKRAKYIFQRVQRPVKEEDEVVTAFRDGAVTLRSNRRTEGFTFSIQEIGYQGIRKGDLVVHAMDGFAGAIGVSDSDGKATPVYTVLRPLNEGLVNNNYYGYLLRNLALAGFVNALAKGIRERSTEFRYNEIKELWLPVLPYAEQTQVVNFVEHEKQKLESLVSTIQQAIDYLKEYRTALISAAVTGKIDVRNL